MRFFARSFCALAILFGISAQTPAKADPTVFIISAVAAATAIPGYLFDLPQPDAKTSFATIGGGVFDIVDDDNVAGSFRFEYEPGHTFFRIKPKFGFEGTSNDSYTFYGAISHDFHLTKYFVIGVETGPALYLVGADGKDLGSDWVLRSGFEAGFRFDNGARATGSLHHMSHGKLLGDTNPGTEVVSFNLSWPLN